jgi:curved DNA-binding protein
MSNHYSILGVSNTASQDQIKQAYRKLAKQHHPDTGGDETKFKEVNAAYQTLKDENKRQEYDQPAQKMNINPTDFEDMFSSFFNQNNLHRRNKDIKIAVTITLEEVATGKEIIAKYILADGQHATATIKIHAGAENGEAIRYKGLGDNAASQIPRGDLLVFINVLQHKQFDRDKNHLYTTYDISVIDLILGRKINVQTLLGHNIAVNIPKGTQPGTIMSVTGHGLPNPRSGINGNFHIVLKGKVPTLLDDNILTRIKDINDDINKSA